MSKRNIIWLIVIIAVTTVVWVTVGVVWALVAGAVVLVVSEVIERQARKRRRAARGESGSVSLRDEIVSRKKR